MLKTIWIAQGVLHLKFACKKSIKAEVHIKNCINIIFILGVTHSSDYHIWQRNEYVSNGVREFSERGEAWTMIKEVEAAGERIQSVYSLFSAPGVVGGTGQATTEFEVYARHSLVRTILCKSSPFDIKTNIKSSCFASFNQLVPQPGHAVLLVLSAGLAGTSLYQPDKPYKHWFN